MKSILYTVCQMKVCIILTTLSTAIVIMKLPKLISIISKWKFKFAIMKERVVKFEIRKKGVHLILAEGCQAAAEY